MKITQCAAIWASLQFMGVAYAVPSGSGRTVDPRVRMTRYDLRLGDGGRDVRYTAAIGSGETRTKLVKMPRLEEPRSRSILRAVYGGRVDEMLEQLNAPNAAVVFTSGVLEHVARGVGVQRLKQLSPEAYKLAARTGPQDLPLAIRDYAVQASREASAELIEHLGVAQGLMRGRFEGLLVDLDRWRQERVGSLLGYVVGDTASLCYTCVFPDGTGPLIIGPVGRADGSGISSPTPRRQDSIWVD